MIINSFNRAVDTQSLEEKDIKSYLDHLQKSQEYSFLSDYMKIKDLKSWMDGNADDKIKLIVDNFKNLSEVDQRTTNSLKVLLKGFNKESVI